MNKWITRRNLKFAGIGWTALGFHRGMQDYDYRYAKVNIYKNKPIAYLYSSRIAMGLFGVILHCNPFTVPIMLKNEIYRAEVNIRGLELHYEDEKDKYHKVLCIL